jgi:hypothetical protein
MYRLLYASYIVNFALSNNYKTMKLVSVTEQAIESERENLYKNKKNAAEKKRICNEGT